MFFLVRLPTEPLAFRHIRYCGRKRNERVEKMKKNGFRAVLAALFLVLLSTSVWAAEMLVPVGRAVGLELEAAGLAVAELDAQLGAHARDAGLEVGDIIIKADGQAVPNAAALQEAVDRSKGGLVLTVLRNGEEMNVTVTPVEHEGRRRGRALPELARLPITTRRRGRLGRWATVSAMPTGICCRFRQAAPWKRKLSQSKKAGPVRRANCRALFKRMRF